MFWWAYPSKAMMSEYCWGKTVLVVEIIICKIFIEFQSCVVVLWFWGWGNEHHNAWRRQLSRDLARASSWEAGCHCCCVAGTRGVRSSLSVVSRVIRRRNADKGLRWSRVGEDVLSVVCGHCRPAWTRCQGVLCPGVVWRWYLWLRETTFVSR